MELLGLGAATFALFVAFGLLVGIPFGFLGMGGSVLVTPALLVVGYPATVAVGSGLAFVFGTSVSSVLRHRAIGQIEYGLAGPMAAGMVSGTWLGEQALRRLEHLGIADLVVGVVCAVLLGAVGLFVLHDVRTDGTAARAVGIDVERRVLGIPPTVSLPHGATISSWIVIAVGLGVGVLSGCLGVGGGFLLVPVMVYAFGVPAAVAVGTASLLVMVSSAFGTFIYAQSGAIGVPVVAALLGGSALGARVGAGATRLVDGADVERYVAAMLLVGCVALASNQAGGALGVATLETAGTVLLFGATVPVSVAVVTAAVGARTEGRESGSRPSP